MKNFKNLFFTVCALVVTSVSFSQNNILNARIAGEIGDESIEDIYAKADGPIPYEYVNDRDVVFQKKVWEVLPLDQRQNLIYYFPLEETIDRKPLWNILKDAVMNKKITEVYYDDNFKFKLNPKDLESKFVRIDTADAGKEQFMFDGKIDKQYIYTTEIRPTDVKEYRAMGMWYLDRNAGELKYRLLGLAPVVIDLATKGTEFEQAVPLFWIFFPDARETLYNSYAFNEKNPAMKINFDYLFNARKFSGSIYKTDNVYGDRNISEYVQGNAMMQLLEAERVKESIRDLEDDLWNY
ncbi:type IX secretion system ring subunit PorN/GldN [Paenimyroides baculatum]|uniref:Gliding motility protein GldN n=1 Tax=Paenimyroides baculatum TaxID=2608000 RepID=A0A5M6CCQ4_9FLAO|nr:gliding motility protein GldN [Paenimyroides baculatum]KAA5532907.1 gliding motility protein GldN [Paenimyroides baculatum]